MPDHEFRQPSLLLVLSGGDHAYDHTSHASRGAGSRNFCILCACGAAARCKLQRNRPSNWLSCSSTVAANRAVALAAKHRLPAIYPARDFVEIGGLMSYGQRGPEMFRFAATLCPLENLIDIPADLPLTAWTKLYLSVNTKTAATLDIALPPSFLSQVNDTVK